MSTEESNNIHNDEVVPELKVESLVTPESQTQQSNDDSSVTLDVSGGEEDYLGIVRKNLTAGFSRLRVQLQRSEIKKGSSGDLSEAVGDTRHPGSSYVTVNFIDPTTYTGLSVTSSNMRSILGRKAGEPQPSLDLYEKLRLIFERDYMSTLHSVPYQKIRSGANDIIETLYVRSVLTRSHGSGGVANGDAMVPWGGTAGTAAAPVSDPAEWHNGPYCHVYIAACENLDHYKAKVKPALQAFVSQIEGAAYNAPPGGPSAAESNEIGVSGNYSAHYVIVYVPTGSKSAEPVSDNASRMSSVFAPRIPPRKTQSAGSTRSDMPGDSIHSLEASVTELSEGDPDDMSAAPPPGPIALSSKSEKELYKRFTSDFPNGKICVLSTLLDSVDDNAVATTSPLKNQEWNTFLRYMASAIVAGFHDRCRRYDEELRRLDSQRGSPSKVTVKSSGIPFHLCHFFLVKESLAFTFEQMQLPSEALLHYDELRAFLPEAGAENESSHDKNGRGKDGVKRRKSLSDEEEKSSLYLAVCGDTVGFRRRLRAETNLAPVAHVVLHYLFSREISLLFKMADPVEVINRCNHFVAQMYQIKKKCLSDPKLSLDEVRTRRLEAESWAFNFCWNVKCACEGFFEELSTVESRSSSGKGADMSDDESKEQETEVARKVSDLLEFARFRLVRLGDMELEGENPIRSLTQSLPLDLQESWQPWQHNSMPNENGYLNSDGSKNHNETTSTENEQFLDGAFSSCFAFESKYLTLTAAIVAFLTYCGRHRMAARIQGERAELYLRRGEAEAAVKTLVPIMNVCAKDQWNKGLFWRIFRLSFCQRKSKTCKTSDYLKTLILTFGPSLSKLAPPKALDILQTDLEHVAAAADVAHRRFGHPPLMECGLQLETASSGTSTMPFSNKKRKLIKHFSTVGETVRIEVKITSHLPRTIQVDGMQLSLSSFETVLSAVQDARPIGRSDAYKILSLVCPITVEPGLNTYEFEWVPMRTGLFIPSVLEITWKQVCFFYDFASGSTTAMFGIDVLPSDPTQTIELNPIFLIPGHTQPVRITFHSGSDIVTEGTIELLCSDGLELIAPGDDPESGNWRKFCTLDVKPCNPSEKIVFTAMLKSAATDEIEVMDSSTSGSVQTMKAKVATRYRHNLFRDLGGEDESSSCMKTVLEAEVTTLDRPALTVANVSAYPYSEGRAVVNILVHCHTPEPFSVKEWNIDVPFPLVVANDLNHGLLDHNVIEGEELFFGFDCELADTPRASSPSNKSQSMLRVVLQDGFGKTFEQMLPFSLQQYYDNAKLEKEYVGSKSISAELKLSADEGLVGSTISLTYILDLTQALPFRESSDDPNVSLCLIYKIMSDGEMDWIVGGKVNGRIICSELTKVNLEFLGIPTRPGFIKSFPKIFLEYDTIVREPPSISVDSKHPACFTSLSFANHMALACPAETEN